jgi:hypothetical protein
VHAGKKLSELGVKILMEKYNKWVTDVLCNELFVLLRWGLFKVGNVVEWQHIWYVNHTGKVWY